MLSDKLVKIIILPLMIFLLFLPTTTKATHMVGGDFTYKCLGNGLFEITLTIRRDCFNGDPEAFFDEEAIITIFDQYGQIVSYINRVGQYRLDYMGTDTLQELLDVECGILGEKVCVEQATYRDTIYLPRPPKGRIYQLIYQRCCRNETLENIKNPLESGNSYKIEIDAKSYDACNDAPHFKEWPPVYICANYPLEFDHSAEESDGDSLVYKFYDPFMGGTFERPRPTLPKHYKPLGRQVEWEEGYGLDNVLGSSVPLSIDAKTGLLTGVPEKLGQFLVGIMVEEYRDGKLLSVIRRDFEFNVRECVPPPIPDFEGGGSVCGSEESDTLVFINKSQMADTIGWSFYLHSTGETFTSTEDVITYIYTLPASGKDTLDVVLSAYQELADCSNEIVQSIYLVRDELKADFDVNINDCLSDSLDIKLNLKDKFQELNPLYTWKSSEWELYFDHDTLYATGQIVDVVVPKENSVRIKLFVDTEENCQTDLEKVFSLEFPVLEFIANPLVNCLGDSDMIIKNPNPNWTYTWEPETGLDFSLDPVGKSNPLVSLDSSLTYKVSVTDGVCTDSGSILVVVRDYFDLSILGPDTICSDSALLQAVGFEPNDSIITFEWSDDSLFTNIIHTGKEFAIDNLNPGDNKFYLRVKEGTGCANNIDSITIFSEAILLDYDKEVNCCTGLSSKIELIKLRPEYDISIHWEDSPLIVEGQDSFVLIIRTEDVGVYDLVFTATTNFGCQVVDTIKVLASEGPELTLQNDTNCNGYEICFKVLGGSDAYDYNWDFGKSDDDSDKSTEQEPCFDYKEPGVYTVSVEVLGIEECTGVTYLTKEVIVEDYFDLSILGPDTICNDSVLLQAVGFDPNDSIIEFEWSDNSLFTNIIHTGEEFAVDNLNQGDNKFYLRVKEGTGCANNIDSITVFREVISLDYDKVVNYCVGLSSKIELIKLSPEYDISIHWEDSPLIVEGQDSLVLTVYTEDLGVYDLVFTATTNFGCQVVDTIKVIASKGPQLILQNDINCETYEMCFKVLGANTSDYHWDFGKYDDDSDKSTEQEPCFDYKEPGVYTVSVEVLVAEECVGVAYLTKEVIVPEFINISQENDEIVYCPGDELELSVSKNETADVKWYKDDNLIGEGDTILYTASGEEEIITIVGYDIYGCTDTVELNLIPYIFEIGFEDPGVRCAGDTLQLEIVNNSGANLVYQWKGDNIIDGENSATPTVVVFQGSEFEVTVTDLDYNCDSTYLFVVSVSDIDIGIETDIEDELVITNSGTITVTNVPDNSTILWSTGESNVETITISPDSIEVSPEERTYCVTVTDEYGCSDQECITIIVVDPLCNEEDIYVPNAFSPNGDNVNDVFRVRGKYIRSVEMRIYDRWGELIYEGAGDENESWDGTFRGEYLPPDAYTYRVHVQCEDTDNWEHVGNVSIIK